VPTVKKNLSDEQSDQPIEFKYDGETYTAPAMKLWPLEVLEAQESGKNALAVKELIGMKQYNKFKAKPRTVADLGDFLEAMVNASGVTPGELEG